MNRNYEGYQQSRPETNAFVFSFVWPVARAMFCRVEAMHYPIVLWKSFRQGSQLMAESVYRNDIVGLLASAVALCSVVSWEREQMRCTQRVVWSLRPARPPPQQVSRTI